MGVAGQENGPWTVARLLAWTLDHLQRSGLDSARLCAEILLAHAMRCERIHLYTRHDQVPDDDVLNVFRDLVRQAAAGQPIAYLTGVKEFFSLPLEVCAGVFIPRPETEILVERTIDLARKAASPLSILDLCTGSGCIAVCVARHLPTARVYASDVSETAVEVARHNAARHNVADHIEFRLGDLFEPWRPADRNGAPDSPRSFDVIVCNPPYVATAGAPVDRAVRDFEPPAAVFAGADGLDIIRRILVETPLWLSAGGHLLLELEYDQSAAVRSLLPAACWQNVVTYRDGAGHERVLHARRCAADHAQVA
jgi:release factor glutamine methyltransferase